MKSADPPETAQQQAAEPPPEPTKKEQSFRVDEIERYLVAKGIKHHDVAGAFSGVAGSKQITIAAATKRVNAWRKAEALDDNDLKDEALTEADG